jgi:cytochrome c biogenesis protein CcmG/thiol:disulfide interchange protein DsbE
MQARVVLPLLIFIALVAVLGIGLFNDPKPEAEDSPMIGKSIPDFTVPDLLDPTQQITQDVFRGDVKLLNVWATWCPSCREEHEVLNAVRDTGVVEVIGLDWKDDREKALRWLERLGNPYARTGFDPDNKVGIELGVAAAPETYVIDAQGVICDRYIGPLTVSNVRDYFLPLVQSIRDNGGACLPRVKS